MSITVEDVIITRELAERPRRDANLRGENRLLHGLARSLGKPTPRLLGSFVEDALRVTGAGSAGVSLLEQDHSGAEIFRWVALAGAYKSFTGGTTPRNFSPCGACLERKVPQLYATPARYFDYFAKVRPAIIEGLVVPIWVAGVALGTIWVTSHDADTHFNGEDARMLSSIAGFLGGVLAYTETSTRYHALSACSPIGVFETDQFGRCTYANAQLQATSGVESKQIVGGAWSLFLPPADRLRVFADWCRKTKKAHEYSEEIAFRRPSGEVRWVHLRSAPLKCDGILKGYVCSVEDITERRERDRLLRESEQFKARILSSSPDCIKVLDSDGRLIFMNATGQKRMEIAELRPLLNRKWTSFWTGKDRLQAVRAFKIARRGSDGKFQGQARTLKGTLKWWDVIVTALRNERGEPERYLAISRDITAQKNTEIALEKAQQQTERYVHNLEARVAERTAQLEKANAQLRSLAAQLIHSQEEERRKLAHQLHDEIGQELTGLKLLLDHGRIRNRGENEAIMRDASEVLAGLITQVSHLAQDLRPAVLERLGLLPALRWQAGRCEKRFDLKVIFDCPPACEDVLSVAQNLEVFRIVQEALTNAARHSGAKIAKLQVRQEPAALKISVQDRGRGFDEKRVAQKASLGLLGMRERVARLGGKIRIASRPNRGTKVELCIPF